MSDQRYINTYVDIAVGTVHDIMNTVLQLKTENKLASQLLQEKDGVIANIQNELDQLRNSLEQERDKNRLEHEAADKAHEQARSWESEVVALRNKASNFDGLANQFNDLKRDFIAKDTELNNVRQQLEEATLKVKELQKVDRAASKEQKSQVVTTKTTINKVTTPKKIVDTKVEQETDDF